MKKIKIKITKYFAGIGYDGYSAKFLDGRTINIRISKNVLKDPEPEKMKNKEIRRCKIFEKLDGSV